MVAVNATYYNPASARYMADSLIVPEPGSNMSKTVWGA